MVSLIKNVIYLSPPVGLAFAGMYCIQLFSNSIVLMNSIILLIFSSLLFYWAYNLGKYSVDSLERISKTDSKNKIKLEKERTKHSLSKNIHELQKIHAKKELGNEKLKQGLIGKFIRQL